MSAAGDSFARARARSDRAWSARAVWDKLYGDAYEFAIPQRRPGRSGRAKTQIDRLFDMTAIVSTFRFAGQLQQDLFPPGRPNFYLAPGPIPKMALDQSGLNVLRRGLEKTAAQVQPFFMTGEWDESVHECCIDLAVGTGHIYVGKGTRDNPLRFVAIPAEDIAVETDAWGEIAGQFWRSHLPRQAVRDAFPEGRFPEDFHRKLENSPDEEILLMQDFTRRPDRRWGFVAYVEDSKAPVAENVFRTRPIASPRYYRVPGEAYGRGPVLLALPTIKTLNKAQELAFKAAAIQMLGIWGYRAGGTFNPDTVRVGPGEFWPMQATGGILGPDVSRLDPASGRLDVSRLVIGQLQDQLRQVLLDNRLPDPAGTPASASEIVARLRDKRDAHIGAFGRLSREIMPVVVPRAMEILHDFGYLRSTLPLDALLVSVEVLSPMAAALRVDQLSSIVNYFELVVATAGPQAVPLYLHLDKTLDKVAEDTQVPASLVPTVEERKKLREQQAAEQAALLAAQMAAAAPQRQAA